MKTITQIEAWTLSVVDLVAQGRKVEDTRIELKSVWPDPAKTARRMAAHANAAGGEEILWIIGLSETQGVVPCKPIDMAEWMPQVVKEFDGLAPLIRDVVVPVNGSMVTALAIDSSRAPYVVKNPNYGGSGETIQWEVPWREGTTTRSARREDLVRMLAAVDAPPAIDVIGGRMVSQAAKALPSSAHTLLPEVFSAEHINWIVGLELYVVPSNRDRIVFPLHRCRLSWRGRGEPLRSATSLAFVPFDVFSKRTEFPSQTVISSPTEVVIDGPGKVALTGRLVEPLSDRNGGKLEVWVELTSGLGGRSVVASGALALAHDNENGMFWELVR